MTLTDLLHELEKAGGGSRELDWAIAKTFYKSGHFSLAPNFSGNIQGAVALLKQVLPGWTWAAGDVDGEAAVYGPNFDSYEPMAVVCRQPPDPPLAICTCVAKAKLEELDK